MNVNSLIIQVSSLKSILANSLNISLDSPPTLRHAEVGIRPFNPNCVTVDYINNPEKIKRWIFESNAKNKICAGNYLQRADHGDSGGPLLYRRNNTLYQIGLFEFLFLFIKDAAKAGKFAINGNSISSIVSDSKF